MNAFIALVSFVAGGLLFDMMWRLVSRLQDKLIEEQKLLLAEQDKFIKSLRVTMPNPSPDKPIEDEMERAVQAVQDDLERQCVALEPAPKGCIDKDAVFLHGLVNLESIARAAIEASQLAALLAEALDALDGLLPYLATHHFDIERLSEIVRRGRAALSNNPGGSDG